MTDNITGPVIDEELAKQLEAHKGRWVAVHEGKVVADGASAKEAYDNARKVKVTDPLVFHASAHPERLNLF